MENNNEFRIMLNENTFTNLCKYGFVIHTSKENGRVELNITRNDIHKLYKGEIIEKRIGFVYKIALQDIGKGYIKEIIKRSPVYSQLHTSLN